MTCPAVQMWDRVFECTAHGAGSRPGWCYDPTAQMTWAPMETGELVTLDCHAETTVLLPNEWGSGTVDDLLRMADVLGAPLERDPARFFLDTEFIDTGRQVHLVSLGVVTCAERCGSSLWPELYLEPAVPETVWAEASPWVMENVHPHLRGYETPRETVADTLRRWVADRSGGRRIEFWGYCPAYDWVAVSQLFGPLTDRPEGWPFDCYDIGQLAAYVGVPREAWPVQEGTEHHALADARWTRAVWQSITAQIHGHGGKTRLVWDQSDQVEEVAVGQVWVWEPTLPQARQLVVVTGTRLDEDGEGWVGSKELARGPAHLPRRNEVVVWNEVGRWREACVRVPGVHLPVG